MSTYVAKVRKPAYAARTYTGVSWNVPANSVTVFSVSYPYNNAKPMQIMVTKEQYTDVGNQVTIAVNHSESNYTLHASGIYINNMSSEKTLYVYASATNDNASGNDVVVNSVSIKLPS